MEIKFNDVSLKINKNTPLEKVILTDVKFEIKEPGIYGFLGNSNSGKSAIADLMDALISPTSGSVQINKFVNSGKKIKKVNKLRYMVGYLFKNPYDMFFNSSVLKELEFGMQYFKHKLEKISMRTVDALKLVGLSENVLNKDPLELDLATAKKVAIASIIIYNPKVIILDEITIGLNYKEKKEIMRLLKLLKDKYNKIIILLSKDTDFLYQIVDYVYLMDNSKMVAEGETELLEDVDLLKKFNMDVPKIVEFTNLVKNNKNVKLNYYKDIKELIKGVYRNVF